MANGWWTSNIHLAAICNWLNWKHAGEFFTSWSWRCHWFDVTIWNSYADWSKIVPCRNANGQYFRMFYYWRSLWTGFKTECLELYMEVFGCRDMWGVHHIFGIYPGRNGVFTTGPITFFSPVLFAISLFWFAFNIPWLCSN